MSKIETIIKSLTTTAEKLRVYSEKCQKDILMYETAIDAASQLKVDSEVESNKALKISNNIKKLLEGE